ncbi:MAG: UDP-N-acetylmuramoyl-L-alanine--D-glutamate ligase [Candidatus Omnitrophota bacterium]
MMELKGKKVTVVGLGKSGVAACNLLVKKGAQVCLTEAQDNPKIRETLKGLDPRVQDIEIGGHSERFIQDQDLVVTSPGVALKSLPLKWAQEKAIPVIAEVELAFRFCPAPVVAISGTNGKTTVTTLTGRVIEAAGRRAIVCGNIGNPFSGEVQRIGPEDLVVLEISSFQLETIASFRPKVAAILNVTADHLDRHADFNEYVQAKCRIFMNQTADDWAVFREDNDARFSFSRKTKAKVRYYTRTISHDERVKGFNDNFLAVMAITAALGIDERVAVETCANFKGIEHRLEEVEQIHGVTFINDSKGTNVDSTLWALDVVKQPIILIAGGRDKDSDFTLIRDVMQKRVVAMVLLGEAKDKMLRAFSDIVPTHTAATLAEAVECAFRIAQPGYSVLFSPMCASFDMFANYIERGNIFKGLVRQLSQRS